MVVHVLSKPIKPHVRSGTVDIFVKINWASRIRHGTCRKKSAISVSAVFFAVFLRSLTPVRGTEYHAWAVKVFFLNLTGKSSAAHENGISFYPSVRKFA